MKEIFNFIIKYLNMEKCFKLRTKKNKGVHLGGTSFLFMAMSGDGVDTHYVGCEKMLINSY